MASNRRVLSRGAITLCAAAAAIGALPGAASAAPAPPPASLAGEHFVGESGSLTRACSDAFNGTADFTVTGSAGAPYPGTFTESGSITVLNGTASMLHVEFTIDSPSTQTTVTGVKDLTLGAGSCVFPGPSSQWETDAVVDYHATLHRQQGAYSDSGTGFFSIRAFSGTPDDTVPVQFFDETFDTSNGVLPADKNACKDGGWRSFPQFKNQGDCVSFVATGGRNG